MNVGFYAAKVQTQVMRYRENIEYAYERYPDTTRFWGLIDLVGSSNYRLLNGPGKGYVRGETFFSLVNEVITPYSEIELLKEIGDASLLAADSLRPLLESLVLADQVALQMRLLAGDEQFPFAIRAGISYGPAKKLNRPHKPQDYLGSPLDQLARILGIRSSDANLFLHEAAYQSQEAIIQEYSAFLSVSGAKTLSGAESKGMLQPVYYRELKIDRAALREFRNHFSPWREAK
jgi:class 3 adenylate cyclase